MTTRRTFLKAGIGAAASLAARPALGQSRDLASLSLKQASDLHSPSINQLVMHRVAEAVFDGQVDKLIGAYRERRDGLLGALEAHMPDGVSWSRPEGGMFVWATLPEGADATALLARAVKEARVAFVPGSAFFADATGRNTLRLSFTLADRRAVSEGIPRLAAILKG